MFVFVTFVFVWKIDIWYETVKANGFGNKLFSTSGNGLIFFINYLVTIR